MDGKIRNFRDLEIWQKGIADGGIKERDRAAEGARMNLPFDISVSIIYHIW